MPPIEAVLFDYGGVITRSPFDALKAIGEEAGLDPDQMVALVFGPYHDDTDHAWHRLERGEITLQEWVAALIPAVAEAGVEFDLGAMAGVFRAMTVQPEVVAKVAAVKAAGIRTALVTNNVAEGSKSWRASIPVDDLFDAVVDSSEVGMRKPNPAIFHHTLELLGGVAPDRAVLLDDAPGNIEGAQRAGLLAILVGADPAPALAELDALLEGDKGVTDGS